MKNFNLSQLQYILALEETGNFIRAAKKSHVTQPTLSMQIQKLEQELGVLLFDRTQQPIIPTLIGQKILDQARKIIKEAKMIEEILTEDKQVVAGTFKLGIIPSLSPYLLPLFLRSFIHHYPHVHLILEELQTETLLEKLQEDKIDAGILVTPLSSVSLDVQVLFYEPLWVYLYPNHPLATAAKISPKEIKSSEVLLLQEGHCFRGQALQLCQKKHSPTNTPRPLQFESGSLEVLKSLVDQGLGMTLLPDLAAKKLVSSARRHLLIPFSSPTPLREVSFVRGRLFTKKKIFEALKESITQCLPPELSDKPEKGSILDLV